eukprot:2180378-Rhodomonas_salina.1
MRRREAELVGEVGSPLSSYAFAMRCPVLSYGKALPGRGIEEGIGRGQEVAFALLCYTFATHQMPGTDVVIGAMALHFCLAMSVNAAIVLRMGYEMSGADAGYNGGGRQERRQREATRELLKRCKVLEGEKEAARREREREDGEDGRRGRTGGGGRERGK